VLYITLCIYVYLPIIVTSTSLTTETVSQGEVEYLELFPWYWSMYSSIHNIVIVAPAKVMHTTIRNVLNHKECSKNNPHCTEIKNKKNNFKFNNQYKRYILNTAIRVLIIRDPYDRSYSAYMNSNHNKYIYINNKCNNTKQCTFEEWVYAISQQGTGCNEHFYSITNISNIKNIKYHYIIIMNYKTDRQKLWYLLNE